jgi:hypothetical protein
LILKKNQFFELKLDILNQNLLRFYSENNQYLTLTVSFELTLLSDIFPGPTETVTL